MDQATLSSTTLPTWIRLGYPTFERQGERACVFWLDEAVTVKLFCGQTITIPAGFRTDGASVPQVLTWLFPRLGDHLLADLVHDYLYSTNLVPKAVADREFLLFMQLLRPHRKSWADNYARYVAVVFFGRGAYARMGELKRFLTTTK